MSPRTADEPRAFTGDEFVRGAGIAYVLFQPIGALVFSVGMILEVSPGAQPNVVGTIFGGALLWLVPGLLVSGLVTLLGMPLAYLLGRRMRRVDRDWIHVLAFFGYGLAVGLAVEYVFSIGSGNPFGTLLQPWSMMRADSWASGVVVSLGWLITSRAALARDRQGAAVALPPSANDPLPPTVGGA
ncbi:hypothetical protein [Microbacterium mangrovi]|uniref:hypothetical protein n=1 Tax=Microbacterium mangrovi TaxID=1348253 RepID=UPI0012E01283|nr:hypothetical protein [Microbacterium mangrovi]